MHHGLDALPASDAHDAWNIDPTFQELGCKTGSQGMEADRCDPDLDAEQPELLRLTSILPNPGTW